ncbi:unnamed protein product, partial [Brachionus calyciflorus]
STLLYSIENLRARVYSIVDNVARVILLDADNPLFMYDLANKLIKIEIFEKCQESYASELKHEERINMRFYEGLEGSKSQNEWIQIENIEKKIKKLHFNRDNPFSLRIMTPIEMRLLGMTKCLKFSKLKTDRQSINRIMLDQEPNLKCSSLVVAHRTADLDQKEIVLRNTCLFPKIKGLVSLVLLAFSPEVEFRYDRKSLKYTGALCGLGFDPIKRRPLYTENDVEEVFEVDFVDNDIKLLNSFRFLVNMLIGSKSSSESYLKNPEVLKNMQSKSRASILKLIAEKRNLKENPMHFNKEFIWNQIPEDHLVSLNDDDRRMYESRKNDKTFYMPLRVVNFAKLKQQPRC